MKTCESLSLVSSVLAAPDTHIQRIVETARTRSHIAWVLPTPAQGAADWGQAPLDVRPGRGPETRPAIH